MSRNTTATKHSAAYALLTLTMFCWAGNAVVARAMRADIAPVALAWWRWVLAALILFPFAWPSLRKDLGLVRQNLPILCVLSILGVSCFNTIMYKALQSTSAINTALVQAIIPATIPPVTWLLFRQGVSLKQSLGIALCIGGAVLVLSKANIETLLNLRFTSGDLLMLLAIMIYSFYSVLLRLRPPMHPLSFLLVTFVLGAFFLTPVYLWEAASIRWTPAIVSTILFVAVVPSIVAFFGWNGGVERVGPNQAGLFMPLISVFAALLSVVFLDDQLQLYHLGGVALIFSGIVIFSRQAAR